MRLVPARSWALILLSVALQVAIFPIAGPLSMWRAALAWVALVPFFLALSAPDRTGGCRNLRDAALLGYGCGIFFYLGNCYWIFRTMHLYEGLPAPVASLILLLFALYLGLYHAFFAWSFVLLHKSKAGIKGALLLAPFLWVTVELARARITGFPWDLLGYSQIDNSLLTRLAPIAGVMSMSFVIVLVNAALSSFFSSRSKGSTALAVVALLAAAGMQLFSHGEFNRGPYAPNRPTAVLLQENLEVGALGKEVEPLSPAEEISQFSSLSLRPRTLDAVSTIGPLWTDRVSTPAVSVVVWPEAPAHLFSNDMAFRASMSSLARGLNAPGIIGSLGVDRSLDSPRGYFLYDSASLFDAAGSYTGRYDKIHLVPWGEFIPFKEVFSFAHKLTEGVGDMDRGHERTVFATGGHTYGVFVCYESIFGDEVREFAKNGAEVLVNISDDGWYGDSGAPWQHLNMARMRAIENHRWVLRSTNTGITTAIDPYGRMQAQAPRHVRGAFAFAFEFKQTTTFYTRHGDWFAWLCALVTFLASVRRLSLFW